MNLEQLTDARLMALSLRQPEAFGVVYRRHIGWVVAYFYERTKDHETAADLAAEAFAQALRSRRRYRVAKGAVGSWLAAICTKVYADFVRRGNAEERARQKLGIPIREFMPFDETKVEEFVELAGESRALDLLEALPEHHRNAVRGRVLDDMSFKELAAVHRCSPDTMRQRFSRGLNAIRSRLREDSP